MAFVVGIDAGGTSLRVALADSVAMSVLAEHKVAASADGGPEAVSAALSALLNEAGLTPDRINSVCAGITKITRGGVRERWEAELRTLLPSAAVRIVPDFVIAFHGAVPEGIGVAVVAGTGSVVYGENAAGISVRVGGRGWEFGDEGSGAWLTTEALRRTIRALDGLAPATAFTQNVCVEFGERDPALLGEMARQRMVGEGRGFLVPLLLKLARERGDGEASDLFVGAGGWLAAQARAAVARLGFAPDAPVMVATVGGLWESGDLLRVPFETVLRRHLPLALVTPPDAAPVVGALRLARRAV